MAESTATAAVLIAATQSVAKVYVIGAIGFLAVKFPRASPLLPASAVGILARLSFNVLVIPLIYSTTAISVSPDSLNEYWFVIVGAVVVMAISYAIPTLLALCIRIDDPHDFASLRIAATFPNVVALPILIFPSLCEYSFVYRGASVAAGGDGDGDGDAATAPTDDELRLQCVATSNTIVFVFFFMWSLVFWSFGYPQLLAVAQRNHDRNADGDRSSAAANENENENDGARPPGSETPPSPAAASGDLKADADAGARLLRTTNDTGADPLASEGKRDVGTTATSILNLMVDEKTGESDASSSSNSSSSSDAAPAYARRQADPLLARILANRWVKALVRTVTSPGFLALAAGFATGCIPPLKAALFDSGGALRFLGSSLETLGLASNSISTMVVAASLVPPPSPVAPAPADTDADENAAAAPPAEVRVRRREGECVRDGAPVPPVTAAGRCGVDLMEPDENPIMSDPTFGPYRRRQRRRSSSLFIQRTQSMVRRQSARLAEAMPLRSSPEMRRLLVWFTLSRLVLAPALVIALIVTLDCATGVLSSVPPLAKLVVIFNSSVPGAMIVVVLLKAQPHLSRTASAISRVYLPTYLIAVFSMAGWTTLGLLVTIPASPDDPTPMICPAKW